LIIYDNLLQIAPSGANTKQCSAQQLQNESQIIKTSNKTNQVHYPCWFNRHNIDNIGIKISQISQ